MSFRISAHKLEIEVGRYKNIPALNRICKVCSSGEVEDERHLIFSCNKYSSLRQSFFTETQKICKNFSTLTQDAQFFWLMNNESEDVIILFSNCIYDCFKNRFKSPSIFILTVPRRYFCCGSLLLLVLAVRIYTLVQLLC